MSATLRAAIVERLQSTNAVVYETPPAPTASTPYVVVYFDSGVRTSDREADIRVRRDHGWQTIVVGKSVTESIGTIERVTGALEDWRPTVDNVTFSKVEHEGTQPVRRDPDMPDRVLFIATDQWRAVSDPA